MDLQGTAVEFNSPENPLSELTLQQIQEQEHQALLKEAEALAARKSRRKRAFVVFNRLSGSAKLPLLRSCLEDYFKFPTWEWTLYKIEFPKNQKKLKKNKKGDKSQEEEDKEKDENDDTIGDSAALPADDPNTNLMRVLDEVKRSNDYDYIFIAGGDGTISWVMSGLVGSNLTIGIIPLGTGNAVAQELGIPRDVRKACELLCQPEKLCYRHMDLMKVREKYFLLHVDIGIGAATVNTAKRSSKRVLGPSVYVMSAVSAVLGHKPCNFKLVIDGDTVHTIEATEIVLCNSATIGFAPGFTWGPKISPSDGVLDIAVFRLKSVGDYATILMDILRKQPDNNNRVDYYKAHKSVSVEIVDDDERKISIEADGDACGHTPIFVELVPGAVKMLCTHLEGGYANVERRHREGHNHLISPLTNMKSLIEEQIMASNETTTSSSSDFVGIAETIREDESHRSRLHAEKMVEIPMDVLTGF